MVACGFLGEALVGFWWRCKWLHPIFTIWSHFSRYLDSDFHYLESEPILFAFFFRIWAPWRGHWAALAVPKACETDPCICL